MTAMAQFCAEVDQYNKEAESRADRLADIPTGVTAKSQVDDILYYDDLYRKAKERLKYLQEHQSLPVDDAQRIHRQRYEVPKAGIELALSVRNLAKNVSTWKGRVGQEKYPDAAAKFEMYQALYQEARATLNRERANSAGPRRDRSQNQLNDASYDN